MTRAAILSKMQRFPVMVLSVALGAALTAFAASAVAAPAIAIDAPAAGSVVVDSATVTVTVDSTNLLSSVVASIGNVSTALSAGSGKWSGALDLSSLPGGAATLTVVATDVLGETTTASRALTHSREPTLTIDTPNNSVARPCLHVKVTCTSIAGHPCDTITVLSQSNGQTIASATQTPGSTGPLVLDRTVSLSPFEGLRSLFYVDGRNVDGVAATRRELLTYVDSSPTLIQVEEVDGRILDFDDARVLFVGPSGVSLEDRATKAVTTLAPGNPASGILLANGGALWEGGEWKDGAFLGNDVSELRSAGTWAAWTSGGSVRRRDLTTGTSVLVARGYSPDIDESGSLVYVDTGPANPGGGHPRRVHLVDPVGVGTGELVAEDPGFPQRWIGKPHVGGTALTWETADGFGVYDLSLRTPQGTEEFGRSLQAPPLAPYRVRAGWFANVRPANGGNGAWTRSPSGTAALASPLSNVDAITALEPDGTIAYDVAGADLKRSRYFGAAGATGPSTPVRIGAGFGRLVHRGATWYQIVERVLYRVDTSVTAPLPACGGADAGAEDAGAIPSLPGPPGAPPPVTATPAATDDAAGCASSGGERPSAWLIGLLGAIGVVAARRRARGSRAQNLK